MDVFNAIGLVCDALEGSVRLAGGAARGVRWIADRVSSREPADPAVHPWPALASLTEPQLRALLDVLVLVVRFDGRVTPAEADDLGGVMQSVEAARGVTALSVWTAAREAEARVDAALGASSARSAPDDVRRAAARNVAMTAARELADPALRREVLQTLHRVVRRGGDDQAEDLIGILDAAFDHSGPRDP